MNKSMQEKRDELSKHLESTASFHFVMGYTAKKAFVDGFNARHAIDLEALEVDIEKIKELEKIKQLKGKCR